VLEASANPYFRATRRQYEHTCRSTGLEPVFAEIAAASEIEAAIAQLARQQPQALVLRADSLIYDHRFEVVATTMKYRLPTYAEPPAMVRDGGTLISCARRRRRSSPSRQVC